MKKIIELGAINSPVLAVNGQIVMTGFTSDMEQITDKIHTALEEK